MDNETTCSICMEEIDEKNLAVVIPCNHEFCVSCIKECIYLSECCPLYRCSVDSILVSNTNRVKVNITVEQIIQEMIVQYIHENKKRFKSFINKLCPAMTNWFQMKKEFEKIIDQDSISLIQNQLNQNQIQNRFQLLNQAFIKFDYKYFQSIISEFKSLNATHHGIIGKLLKYKILNLNLNHLSSGNEKNFAYIVSNLLEKLVDQIKSMSLVFEQTKISFDLKFSKSTELDLFENDIFDDMYPVWTNIIVIETLFWTSIKTCIITDVELINPMAAVFQEIDFSKCIICSSQTRFDAHCRFNNCNHSVCMMCVHKHSIYKGYCPMENHPMNHSLYLHHRNYIDIQDYWIKNFGKTQKFLHWNFSQVIRIFRRSISNHILVLDDFMEKFIVFMSNLNETCAFHNLEQAFERLILHFGLNLFNDSTENDIYDALQLRKSQFLDLENEIYDVPQSDKIFVNHKENYLSCSGMKDVLVETQYSAIKYMNERVFHNPTINDHLKNTFADYIAVKMLHGIK